MATRIYSVRFLQHQLANAGQTYWVPDGHRAVVRSVTGNSNGAAGCVMFVAVAGLYVWSFAFPASQGGKEVELRLVAYAGESLSLYLLGTGLAAHMSGFLFEDGGGAPAAAAPVVEMALAPGGVEL